MKVVYTPKKQGSINVAASRGIYNCDAYTYFKEKRKDDLLEIVNEINRREEERYHLPNI